MIVLREENKDKARLNISHPSIYFLVFRVCKTTDNTVKQVIMEVVLQPIMDQGIMGK